MATDKTPTHKRISRAENSSTQWKMKAIERREAAERLKVWWTPFLRMKLSFKFG